MTDAFDKAARAEQKKDRRNSAAVTIGVGAASFLVGRFFFAPVPRMMLDNPRAVGGTLSMSGLGYLLLKRYNITKYNHISLPKGHAQNKQSQANDIIVNGVTTHSVSEHKNQKMSKGSVATGISVIALGGALSFLDNKGHITPPSSGTHERVTSTTVTVPSEQDKIKTADGRVLTWTLPQEAKQYGECIETDLQPKKAEAGDSVEGYAYQHLGPRGFDRQEISKLAEISQTFTHTDVSLGRLKVGDTFDINCPA